MSSARPRVIFDCNVYVQAVAFKEGPSAELLRCAEAGAIELLFSRDVIKEVLRVVQYDDVRALNPELSSERIQALFDRLRFRGTLVRRPKRLFVFRRDPDDEPYLDLAAATKADWLVTRDKDILSLATSHTAFAKRFRQLTPTLRIGDPGQLLKAIEVGDV